MNVCNKVLAVHTRIALPHASLLLSDPLSPSCVSHAQQQHELNSSGGQIWKPEINVWL